MMTRPFGWSSTRMLRNVRLGSAPSDTCFLRPFSLSGSRLYSVPTTLRVLLFTPNTSQPASLPSRFASLLSAETYLPILSVSKSLPASLNSTVSSSQFAISFSSRERFSSLFFEGRMRKSSFLRLYAFTRLYGFCALILERCLRVPWQ